MGKEKIYKKKLFFIAPLFIFILLLFLLGFYLTKSKKVHEAVVDYVLPHYSLSKLNNPTEHIFIDELPKPAIINFFASWCVPCQYEHEALLKLKQFTTIPIYGIVWHDTADKVNNWLTQNGNPFHELLVDQKREFGIEMGVTAIPETFVINKEGKVIFHQAGVISNEILVKKILPLISN